MEICLIGILSHLMPGEVLYSPKVSRKIRAEKADTIICSASHISHLGKLRPSERPPLTQCHPGSMAEQGWVFPACPQVH